MAKRQKTTPIRFIVLRSSQEEVTFAEIRARLTEDALARGLADERNFFAALRRAVTDWVRATDEGRQWYEDTSQDANIGDLCAYGIPARVAAALAKQGIRSLTLECTSTADRFVCRNWTYDMHLADEGTLEQEARNVDLPKEALP